MYKIVKGKPISKIQFNIVKADSGRYKNKPVCDNIFCFDTETTNDYIINGVPHLFDYDNPKNSHDAIKHSLVYVWQFSIDDNVFMGRELEDFERLLIELKAYCPEVKFVYIHNLAFDFVYLLNIINFDDVFARKSRHPMTARSKFFNIEFRCSYVLTGYSLAEWAKAQNLFIKKAVGLLDYSAKLRTPYTYLTQQEIKYCIYDVLTMYYGLRLYRDKYGFMYKIPLTRTGEMRRASEQAMQGNAGYCLKVSEMIPPTLDDYIEQCDAFIGGTVLCNWLYKNITVRDVDSWDIASSYPWALLAFKYPMGRFYEIKKNFDRYMNNDKYLYIIEFEAESVESLLNCHFLSKSKAINTVRVESDNGRIIRADKIHYILTSVDFELFKRCYSYDKESFKILKFKFCRAGYLADDFRRFILECYADKTTLKNVSGREKEYLTKKQYINSAYGDFVTKIFSDDIEFNNGEYKKILLNDATYNKKKTTAEKKKYKNYKAFIQGVFVTAWARSRLWNGILSEDSNGIQLDESLCYCDTDSLKVTNYHGDFFERENKFVLTRQEELAKELNVSIEMFRPKDIKGITHPIGVFEFEEHYKKFRSLGCKQYIIENEAGELHLTCAGISKKAVKCFNTIEDFKIDTKLTEIMLKDAGCEKLIPTYSNDYPIVKYPDGYICKYKHGINLMPTTFNLSMTPNDLLLLLTEVKEKQSQCYYMRKGANYG